MNKLTLSERQKPRALELYRAAYAAHLSDSNCGLGETCPKLVELKAEIEALEAEGVKPTVSWLSDVK
jgi:hypothetical protein